MAAKPAVNMVSVTPSDGGMAFSVEPLLPRDRRNDAAVLIKSASMISCGDTKCSDDRCLLIIDEMGDRFDAAVIDDNEFRLGDDINPLPLAVNADEKGAAAMATSADRLPIYIMV